MKKLLAKLVRRNKSEESGSRITTDTVAEHRERILAGGRKFKYPIQYAKHKLVINTVIISTVAILTLVFVGLWQLYSAQNTSEFMYKVTQVLPLPVASVDGQRVDYSDYLMRYRSAAHYLETKEQVNLNSEDGKIQVDFIKQQAMSDAVADAYAQKLAKELSIEISDVELEAFLKSQRQSSDGEVSQQTYDAVILDYYNWNQDEYRHATKAKLLRQKVSYEIDMEAKALVDKLEGQLANAGSSLSLVSKSAKAVGSAKVIYGQSGWVPKTNQDGGLATVATKLKKGEVSSVIQNSSANGYYFVKLLDINDTQVKYEYLQIPLTTFSNKLQALKDEGKIDYYITLNDSNEDK